MVKLAKNGRTLNLTYRVGHPLSQVLPNFGDDFVSPTRAGIASSTGMREDISGSPEFNALLVDARQAFPRFYRIATLGEVELMDGLVLGRAALVVTMNAPRAHAVPEVRASLERVSDFVDQLFANLREGIRTCPAFVTLSAEEKLQIERLVFGLIPNP